MDKYMFYKESVPIAIGMKTKISESPPERPPDLFFRAGIIRAGVAIFPLLNFVRGFLCEPCDEKHPLQYFEKSIKKYQKVSNVKKRFAPSNVAKCCIC
jgi:hypothetical protein